MRILIFVFSLTILSLVNAIVDTGSSNVVLPKTVLQKDPNDVYKEKVFMNVKNKIEKNKLKKINQNDFYVKQNVTKFGPVKREYKEQQATPLFLIRPVSSVSYQHQTQTFGLKPWPWSWLSPFTAPSVTQEDTNEMMMISKILPHLGIYPMKILIRSNPYADPPPPPPPNTKVLHIYYRTPSMIQQQYPSMVPQKYTDIRTFHDHRSPSVQARPGKTYTTLYPSTSVGLKNVMPYNPNPPLYYHVPISVVESLSNEEQNHNNNHIEVGVPVAHPSIAPPLIHRHPTLTPQHYQNNVEYNDITTVSNEAGFVPVIPHVQPSPPPPPPHTIHYFVPKEDLEEPQEVHNYEPKLGFDTGTERNYVHATQPAHLFKVLPLYTRFIDSSSSSPQVKINSENGAKNPNAKHNDTQNNLTYPLFKPTPFTIVDRSVRPVVEHVEENRRNHRLTAREDELETKIDVTTMATTTTTTSITTNTHAIENELESTPIVENDEKCIQKCLEDHGVVSFEQICTTTTNLIPSKAHFDCAQQCSKLDFFKQVLEKCKKN